MTQMALTKWRIHGPSCKLGIIIKLQVLRIPQVVIINQTMARVAARQMAPVVAIYFKMSMEIVGSDFKKSFFAVCSVRESFMNYIIYHNLKVINLS